MLTWILQIFKHRCHLRPRPTNIPKEFVNRRETALEGYQMIVLLIFPR